MKITHFFFCDDIRQEINNKLTFVGAYVEKISFNFKNEPNWPATIRLGLYVRVEVGQETLDKLQPDTCMFEISHNGTSIMQYKSDDTGNGFQDTIVPFHVVAPITIPGEGKLTVSFSLLKEEKEVDRCEWPYDFWIIENIQSEAGQQKLFE